MALPNSNPVVVTDSALSIPTDAPLPRAFMLNYLSSATSPTRVRLTAARFVVITGMGYFATAAVSIYLLGDEILNRWDPSIRQIDSLTHVMELFARIMNSYEPLPLLLCCVPCALILGCLQLAIAPAVKRGKRIACLTATAAAIVLEIETLLLTFAFGAAAVLNGVGKWSFSPRYLFLLLPAGLGVLIILLLKDLITYLSWIARNPIAEKHPVSFLSGKEKI